MRDVLDITKALADGNRLRVLIALEGGELCVWQIMALLQLAPSTSAQKRCCRRWQSFGLETLQRCVILIREEWMM